jgi:hypothetical protein
VCSLPLAAGVKWDVITGLYTTTEELPTMINTEWLSAIVGGHESCGNSKGQNALLNVLLR